MKGRGNERKGSKDVSPCCRLGLSRRRRLCLLEACCCIRTWGGLCIRERGRIISELRVCSGDLETCFEDWIGATCLEAWIGGCAERLLGIPVQKLLLFHVRC